ncbi:hypothetical protein BZG35_16585 [Brevundimonas sp. LM2]|uniref:hypothetical protein n=1 Tax=Brevundimonas sp. LM2 TaxID=1938605 RepID=UPI0009839B6A|nr:hypothetical protein [Brevundimonas sp. LM2]AQR63090.1 hypothetical protein BZG35_16585 [Brevundimonas sp. LM2]
MQDFEISVLTPSRRVVLVLRGPLTASRLTDEIIQLVQQRPELAGWDWINAVGGHVPDATLSDVERLAAVFRAAEPPAALTVFVSRDPALPAWSSVMDHMFGNRRHFTALSIDQAASLIDDFRAAGKMDRSGVLFWQSRSGRGSTRRGVPKA